MKNVAIILAAGSGSRMKSDVKKQYMEINGYPLVYFSLKAFQESFIDEIIMVVSPGDEEYCKKEIVDKYGFSKVVTIVPGGKERYHSVYAGLGAVSECDYVYIHDGARAFIDQAVIRRCFEEVKKYRACVAAIPVKDTIKTCDDNGYIKDTLNRNYLWAVQTPQVFEYELILDCYKKLLEKEQTLIEKGIAITDDTMAVETFSDVKVKFTEGSYENIKVTTPEDMLYGQAILENRRAK